MAITVKTIFTKATQRTLFKAVPRLTPIDGAPGAPGADGDAATIAVGNVTTLSPGSPATVTNVGTSADAVFDFGIPAGASGSGTGDMLAATYDPQAIGDDAFDRANHTGTQLAATISNFSTAADARVSAAIGSTVQAYSANLDEWSGINPSANGASLVSAADYSAMRTLLGLVIGTNVQAYDADLTSWAGVTRASGFDTFAATPSSANLASLVTNETGSGSLVFGTNPTISTIATGAVTSRSLAVRQQERINVKDYGAAGDGVTNDTAAIDLAETYRASVGGTLWFPAGTYLTAGHTVNRANGGCWSGDGARLIASANSTTFLSVSGAATGTSARKFVVEGLIFDGNSKTGVSVIVEAAPYLTTLQNLEIINVLYAGIFNRGRGVTLDRIQQYGTGSWLISGVGTGVNDRIFDVTISNINHQSLGGSNWSTADEWFYFYRAIGVMMSNVITASLDGAAEGIRIEGACEGVFIVNSVIVWPTLGIIGTAGADGVRPSYVYLTNVGVDQPETSSIDWNGAVFRLTNVNATFGDVQNNTEPGVRIRANSTDVWIAGLRVANMEENGLQIDAGAQVKATGLELVDCNQAASSFYDLDIGASTAANVTIYGKNNWGTANATVQVLQGKATNLPVFPGFGSFSAGVGQIYTTTGVGANGLTITAVDAGGSSTNDFGFFSTTGGEMITNPHGTNNIRLGGTTGTVGIHTAPVGDSLLKIDAGAAGYSPLQFTSGTNRTSVAAGDWEYDGKALYFAHAASSRGVVPSVQMVNLDADRTGSDVNTAQAWFASTEDAFTVIASTTYRFHAVLLMSRAAGSTSHTTGFLLGGTATFTSIHALARVSNPTGNVLGAESAMRVTAATETVLTAANTATTEDVRIEVVGTIRVNGAGTIIPQFKYSAAPGGAPTIQDGTFFEIWPVGSNTMKVVGNIA